MIWPAMMEKLAQHSIAVSSSAVKDKSSAVSSGQKAKVPKCAAVAKIIDIHKIDPNLPLKRSFALSGAST